VGPQQKRPNLMGSAPFLGTTHPAQPTFSKHHFSRPPVGGPGSRFFPKGPPPQHKNENYGRGAGKPENITAGNKKTKNTHGPNTAPAENVGQETRPPLGPPPKFGRHDPHKPKYFPPAPRLESRFPAPPERIYSARPVVAAGPPCKRPKQRPFTVVPRTGKDGRKIPGSAERKVETKKGKGPGPHRFLGACPKTRRFLPGPTCRPPSPNKLGPPPPPKFCYSTWGPPAPWWGWAPRSPGEKQHKQLCPAPPTNVGTKPIVGTARLRGILLPPGKGRTMGCVRKKKNTPPTPGPPKTGPPLSRGGPPNPRNRKHKAPFFSAIIAPPIGVETVFPSPPPQNPNLTGRHGGGAPRFVWPKTNTAGSPPPEVPPPEPPNTHSRSRSRHVLCPPTPESPMPGFFPEKGGFWEESPPLSLAPRRGPGSQ